MPFPPAFLDDIRARVSVSDVVGGRVRLQRRGREFVGLSPFKKERTPSFTVNDQKGFYHCFASGENGDIFTFLMKTEGLTFPEAVERLAAQAGLEVPRQTPEAQRQARARDARAAALHAVLADARAFFESCLWGLAGREALGYLKNRGLADATIRQFGLGFAPPDGGGLRRAIGDPPMDRLLESGLYRPGADGRSPYPFFRNRIMFPILDARGRVIAFGGRFMGDAQAARTGKYINSPATPLFDKGRTLYNLPAAREAARGQADRPLVVAEGYMDVIALSQAGWPASVAPLGTALTVDHLSLLWRMSPAPVLCFDGDVAGAAAAARAASAAMGALRAGKTLRIAQLSDGYDPDTLLRASGAEAMRVALDAASPLHDFLLRREVAAAPLNTPESKADLERRLHALAGAVPDPGVRRAYQEHWREALWQLRRQRRDGPRGVHASSPTLKPLLPRRFPSTVRRAPMLDDEKPVGASLRAEPTFADTARQKLVLAVLMNHPHLLPDYAESLEKWAFHGSLDRVRDMLQKTLAFSDSLDAASIKAQLVEDNPDGVLAALLLAAAGIPDRQVRQDAPERDIRVLLDNVVLTQEQENLAREIKALTAGMPPGPERERQIMALHRSYEELSRQSGKLPEDAYMPAS